MSKTDWLEFGVWTLSIIVVALVDCVIYLRGRVNDYHEDLLWWMKRWRDDREISDKWRALAIDAQKLSADVINRAMGEHKE